jgi:hypothetical protein
MSSESTTYDGGCLCGFVRYRMTTKPLIVHCCHCRSCQRQTGSAFAVNALIEPDRVQLLEGEVEVVDAPSDTGKGQKISHCPKCRIQVWSKHAESAVWFVHVGTLDEPDRLPPDIHVFTRFRPIPGPLPGSTTPAKFGPRKVCNDARKCSLGCSSGNWRVSRCGRRRSSRSRASPKLRRAASCPRSPVGSGCRAMPGSPGRPGPRLVRRTVHRASGRSC